MTVKGIHAIRLAAEICVIVAAAGAATLALAGPASAKPFVQESYIEVPQCQPATAQLCPQIPTAGIGAIMSPTVSFTTNTNHCSDIIAHILVDGREYVSTKVGPGQPDGGHVFRVNPGPHVVGVQAEGVRGGCNTTGTLLAWGGTLHVQAIDNGIGVAPVIDVE